MSLVYIDINKKDWLDLFEIAGLFSHFRRIYVWYSYLIVDLYHGDYGITNLLLIYIKDLDSKIFVLFYYIINKFTSDLYY